MISQSEVELQPLTPGRLMARYCVSFATMENFTQLRGDESLKELVEVISSTREFWDVKLRTSEKRVLNGINKTKASVFASPSRGES
ncbi:probable ATP-dependent DNA helicase HFM1 [Penaeus monodon]|uniref:probable ATP-dependent DNA helicase HFM1 n=1 Tax=Penaeus monodon TaxID=6687 RepID=UPI0018A6DD59|nr:probable ATP-dependent DNA helicase HFM1 [Penaeus monodon]